MPHSSLPVESLVTESADVIAIAEFVIDEIDELVAQSQGNSDVIARLKYIRDVMVEVTDQYAT